LSSWQKVCAGEKVGGDILGTVHEITRPGTSKMKMMKCREAFVPQEGLETSVFLYGRKSGNAASDALAATMESPGAVTSESGATPRGDGGVKRRKDGPTGKRKCKKIKLEEKPKRKRSRAEEDDEESYVDEDSEASVEEKGNDTDAEFEEEQKAKKSGAERRRERRPLLPLPPPPPPKPRVRIPGRSHKKKLRQTESEELDKMDKLAKYRGVFRTTGSRYNAAISIANKVIDIGTFDKAVDAALAWDKYCIETNVLAELNFKQEVRTAPRRR
jgi:hypothetical protein